MQRELTGRHVLAITLAAFGIIIAVNVTMAWKAVSTFPGLEVKNSYVASQTFDAERTAQERLGWTARTVLDGDVLRVTFTGRDGGAADAREVSGLFGRATETVDDQTLSFVAEGAGVYAAKVRAGTGHWLLMLHAQAADGTAWRQRVSVPVR